jgi:uncharacterized repeat protein (TIGR01451 family)
LKRARWFAILAVVAGVVTLPSKAATMNVAAGEVIVSNNGLCSLREAILNAEAGGLVSGDCVAGSPGPNTIVLGTPTTPGTYVLPDADLHNADAEVNGLPEIHSQLTIDGNGAVIQRDPALGAGCAGSLAKFRIFYVSTLGELTLINVTLQNGCAQNACANGVGICGAGGAIFNRGSLTIDNVTFSNNQAFRSGGAIHNDGTLVLTQSTVNNNAVLATQAGGGGITNRGGMGVVQSTISNNTGAGSGGGVDTGEPGTGPGAVPAAATFTNSTVSSNVSEGDGGGIFNRSPFTGLSDSTVAFNRGTNSGVAGPGSGIYVGAGAVKLFSSLVAKQVNGANCFGVVADGGHNLADDATCLAGIVTATPLIGPLANNGGPTQTHALFAGSPAIDAGDTTISNVDQRGIFRPQGTASDIGAFEVVGPTVSAPVVSPASTNEGTSTSFTVSGTFTDPAGALAQPFTAVINWGDTTTSIATVSGGGNPFSYSFSGSHTYAQSGSYSVTASVTNNGGGTGTSAPTSVPVANVPPTVGTPGVSPTSTSEAASTSFTVNGTFSDPAAALDQPYTAVINWGDSTTSIGTVSGGGNPFIYGFSGSHTYAQSGSYNVTVSVTDKDGGTGTSAATTVTVANIAPTVSTPVVSPTSASEGVSASFSASGTFTDPASGLDQPFTAVINWGDSTTSTATVTGSANPFNYNFGGTHTYAQSGSYNVTASITDKDGGTGTSAASVVTVTNAAPTVGTPIVNPASANRNVSTSFSVSGTFTDPAGALDQPFTAVVDWGDSTTSVALVTGGANPFNYSFNGTHTYATAGTFNVTVSVTDKDGATGTSAPASVAVAAPADLSITKNASGPFFASNPATYIITVTNNGPNTANAVVVTDTIPTNTTFVSATPTQGTCTGTTTVTCTLGAIANGGSAMITLKVTPSTEGPLSNTASVSAAPQPDPTPANDSSAAVVTVLPAVAIPAIITLMLALLGALLAAIALRK